MKSKFFILVLLCANIVGCNRVKVFHDEAAYLTYLKELNLSTTEIQGGVEYHATIRPTEWLALRSETPLDSIDSWYGNRVELQLEMTDTNTGKDLLDVFASDSKEFGIVLDFLNTGIKFNTRLIADGDTLYPTYNNQIKSYGIQRNNPILLGFELSKPLRDYSKLKIEYFDVLFTDETFFIDLNNTDFNKTPRLI